MLLFTSPPSSFQPNPMVIKHGKLEGFYCKTCSLLIKKEFNGKNYYKCKCRGDTNGSGTDHRIKWDACRLYGGVIRDDWSAGI